MMTGIRAGNYLFCCQLLKNMPRSQRIIAERCRLPFFASGRSATICSDKIEPSSQIAHCLCEDADAWHNALLKIRR